MHAVIIIVHSIDTYLTAWCSSINSNSIINDNLQFVRNDSLQVYCGSSSVDYEQNKTDYVAPKILADSQHDSQKSEYKAVLYRLWELHPHVRDYCCKSNTNMYQQLVNKLTKFENTFYNYVGGLTKTSAMELRKELSKLCSTSLSDTFCYIYPALDLIDCAAHLPSSKSNWNSGTEIYRKAVLVNAFILKKDSRYSPYYSGITISESETDILVDCTNEILKLVQNKETEKLEKFAKYLPPSDAYEAATAATSCGTENLCIFMKIVEQVRLYLDSVYFITDRTVTTVNGTRRLILNTGTDYREFLRQKQLDRILTVLSEQHSTSLQIANDLKKHATTKFTELRTYFEKVAKFNQKIADADIAFIHGRIDEYQKRLDIVVPKLKKDLSVIIKYATKAAGLDVAEKTVLLALEVADACNPLKAIFGPGGSIQDVMRATADLANAIARTVKIAKVKRAFDELAEKTRDIGERLEKNDEFLGVVKILIETKSNTRESFKASMNTFLTKYNDYNPQVTLPEISGHISYWHSLIEAACGVIEETDSAASSVHKSILNNKGLCESTPALADEMTAIYEEIYEYQFDLMDAMAAYVRSSVALDAAKEINNEFQEVTKLNVNSGTTLTTLQMMGGLSYMTYTTYVLETVHLYCNVLEYMEGGKQPPECIGVDTDVALLIANIEPVCVSETYRYYYVPTSNSTENDKAYVDINKLMSGSLVHFQVPDATWLVDHEWINKEEKDFAFYVKKFNVFLPAESEDHATALYVTTDPVLHNSIIPEATEYIIVPHTHMIQEYSIGRESLPCGPQQKVENPYTTCRKTDTSQICQYSHMTNWLLYPSIYTQWSIRVKGGKDFIVPNPSTDMSVIFGIQLCKVPSGDGYRADVVKAQWTSGVDNCCPDGHYRPNVTSSCVECPAGSHSALAGYYCEHDEHNC